MVRSFYKYEGAGNDFILIDNRDGAFVPSADIVAALCDRRFGIGADGLMLLESDVGAEFRMRYFNADGGESTMCGNGGRCIALFAHHLGIGGRHKKFSAADGLHEAEIMNACCDTGEVTLGMSDVCDAAELDGGYIMDTGSPHYVRFVDNVDALDVFTLGRELRYDEKFAKYRGVNIDFAEIREGGVIKARTYERGVENETLACGTGAVACAIAARFALGTKIDKFTVDMPGGMLTVSFDVDEQGCCRNVTLTGPARKVFSGSFDTENFL